VRLTGIRRHTIGRVFSMMWFVMAVSAFGAVPLGVVRFHGVATPLRAVLEMEPSGFLGGELWTYGQTALSVHPRPRADLDKELRPMWVWDHDLAKQGSKRISIFRRSTFILMMQLNDDPSTCLVNVLSGERVLSESARAQDETTQTITCAKVTGALSLGDFPRQALDEIDDLLKKAASKESKPPK
jgi:hypothetical protein